MSLKNQSHYRPGQALRVPWGWGAQISRQSAHEGGKVVSPTHRPPLPPRKYSWYSFLLEAESTPGPCQWKIPVTPSQIEPATFRPVAQCLNRLRHRVPSLNVITDSHTLNTAPVTAGNILIAIFTDHQFLTVSVTDEEVWNAGVRMTGEKPKNFAHKRAYTE